MEDVNVLITYISGGKNPAIAGFWKDRNGKERAVLEPIYKTSCFGVPVTDGEKCMHALKHIETAFHKSTSKGGLKLAYWEILETAPEDRGALFMALKATNLSVIPVNIYNRDEINTLMAPEVATAIFPECRREICLAGTGYTLLAARNKWREWTSRGYPFGGDHNEP